jgi:hypothetical protein
MENQYHWQAKQVDAMAAFGTERQNAMSAPMSAIES